MQIQLPQFFEDSNEGFVTFELSFLQRVGNANLVAGAPAGVEFDIDAGKAGYMVEQGNNLSFGRGPGRSKLKLARERQLVVELAARIVRGSPILKFYIIQYDANGLRLRQSAFRFEQDRFRGSLTLARDVDSYMLAIRLAGRGIVEFGEFHTSRDSADRFSGGSTGLAITGSAPVTRLTRKNIAVRVADAMGRLDRRHLAKGVDLARQGVRRLRSRVTLLATAATRSARPAERAGDNHPVAAAESISRLKLRRLNGDLALLAKSDPAAWLAKALEFAISTKCYETAERLARYTLAIWPQIDASHRKSMLGPLLEVLAVVGDRQSARALLEENASAILSDDALATYARLLDSAPVQGLADFLLPSGKLDVFSLSVAKADTIDALQKTKARLFARDPQNYLLLCNTQVGESAGLFCKYLNKSLAPYGAGHASSVAFGGNILENIEFRLNSPVSGGPRVSVIMAAHNAAGTVGYAARSILRQDYRNIELLICDDGSDDDTMAAIRGEAGGDERVRIFRSDANQGKYNIRNALLGLARSPYVTFHDAGDYALPSRIRLQIGVLLARRPQAVVARVIHVRPSGEFVFCPDQSALHEAPVSIMAAKETFVRYGPYRSARFGNDAELIEKIRDGEGAGSVHQMDHPLLLSPEGRNMPARDAASEILEGAHHGFARRRLSELTARQRLLGPDIVPEREIVAALAVTGNIGEPCPVAVVEWSAP